MILVTVDEKNAVIALKLYSFIKQKQPKNKHTFIPKKKKSDPKKGFSLDIILLKFD